MVESEIAERIAARRAELDDLEDRLAKQLAEVRAERDELAVVERVWRRMAEQLAAETAAAGPPVAQVAGRAVLLVPHRGPGVTEDALPPEYQHIAIVRQVGAPVAVITRLDRRFGWGARPAGAYPQLGQAVRFESVHTRIHDRKIAARGLSAGAALPAASRGRRSAHLRGAPARAGSSA
ncbi:hypothetical protein [Streptomyces sp. NPDC059928]|uniref:hypothetical protein n=1 Tax=unclassified Streptomyces TaxID=2593676 RepID=UPI00364EF988